MYYKVASIVLNSEQKASTASDIFIAQPDSHKESLAGKLFILIEIESSQANALKLTNFLVNTLNYNYYQNDKIALRENIDSIKIENIFQDCLAKTNHALVDFLEQEKIKISPYAFNINVAVIHDDELHFSSVGKHKNLLIYKEKISPDPGIKSKTFEPVVPEYKITNIGSDSSKRVETVNINKLFSDITSGHIPSNGYLLMINEALAEYMSNKQLLKIVTKLSPAGAAEQIKNTLSQINAYVSFLGIIIKNSTNSEITHEEIKKEMEEKHQHYSNKITSLEEETEQIMAPSGIINFKRTVQSLLVKILPAPSNDSSKLNREDKNKKIFIFQDHVFFKRRKNIFKNIQILSKSIAHNAIGFSSILFKHVSTLAGNSGSSINPFTRLRVLISKNYEQGGLKKRNKIILTIAIIFLIIFAVNLFRQNRQNKIIAEQKALTEMIAGIENNQNKIAASLLYNNETEAKRLLAETRLQISQLENNEQYNTDQLADILAKEQEQVNTIRKIVQLEAGKQIADFSILNRQAKPENLILNDDKIYLADSSQKTIYQIDLDEEINTANSNLPDDITELRYPALDDNAVYYFNQGNIVTAASNEALSQAPVSIPNQEEILAMRSFNSNLYLLSAQQIYRVRQAGANWQEPEPWLVNEGDVTEAIDISIDGFVYTLKKDGSVDKFLRGQKQDFKLDSLYQPITNADKIIASSEHGNIYLSELSEKRLVVFDKEGKFVKQYIFNTQDQINDVIVDEQGQVIYILSGTSVFAIDISVEE